MAVDVATIGRHDVEVAATRIGHHVRQTPVILLESGALGVRGQLALKLELLQHTGSFKPRGAFNKVLADGAPAAGLIAASGGNHGLAVAYVARELGLTAEVFVPTSSSAVKVARLRTYGARVTVSGAYYADAYLASQLRAAETGALVVHAYDQPETVAGQGTVGRELDQQAHVDTVLVAVGGGGLVGGIAAWFDGHVQVVGVEPERIPTLAAALSAGHGVDVAVGGVAVDSLGSRRIGVVGLAVAQAMNVRSVLVTDEAILDARQQLWDSLRVATEPGGATAMAALTSGRYQPAPRERVAVVICGGNTDPGDLVPEA